VCAKVCELAYVCFFVGAWVHANFLAKPPSSGGA